jgi:hypothetical protein
MGELHVWQHAGDEQQQVYMTLVALVTGHKALREPNMMALL